MSLDEAESLREENRQLRTENQRLRIHITALAEENQRLRQLLKGEGISSSPATYADAVKEPMSVLRSRCSSALGVDSGEIPHNVVTKQSSLGQKIELFRSYFRGRDDVYAVNIPERGGKVCYYVERERVGWDNGKPVWGKPLPLTDNIIKMHLQEENRLFIVGLYPLLLDETCWFLAVDFDKASWQADVLAFIEACDRWRITAALERSRSGNGGHVWIFFAEPVPARLARALGAGLLTRTFEKRHQIGLDSYDRMFPNQDTLPKNKKLGNLIALPFQRIAGKKGNSLFVDHQFHPHPDQWIYLSSLKKVKLSELETIVHEMKLSRNILAVGKASDNVSDGDEPWNLGISPIEPFCTGTWPKQISIVLGNLMYVRKQGLNSAQMNFLKRLAAFQNPDFYQAQALRLSTVRKPRIIDCSDETSEYIGLPRGCQEELMEQLSYCDTEITIEDQRNAGKPVEATFQETLRSEQRKAVDQLLLHDIGTLSATTAFGKTVIGAWMIAARGVNTLVLVDRVQLQTQWIESLSTFLNVTQGQIGTVGGGKSSRTGIIDIVLLQSIYSYKEKTVQDYVRDYGHIIVDECHHIAAFSFEQVLRKVTARYVLGLTATLVRKDGKHPIVLMQCGPVRYRVHPRTQAITQPFAHVVIPRRTNVQPLLSESDASIQDIYRQLTENEARNDMIFDDLLKALDEGRSPLLLTDRRTHLEYFYQRLKGFAKNVIVLHGRMGKRQWAAAQDKLRSVPPSEERVILATGRFLGEGFDDERLDTLFLVMPISWKGTLQQYAGRLHRLYDQKREVQIYDYIDDQISMLQRMYQKRLKGYHAMGYTERETKEKQVRRPDA